MKSNIWVIWALFVVGSGVCFSQGTSVGFSFGIYFGLIGWGGYFFTF